MIILADIRMITIILNDYEFTSLCYFNFKKINTNFLVEIQNVWI